MRMEKEHVSQQWKRETITITHHTKQDSSEPKVKRTHHLGEEASLDDDGDRGEVALAEDLEESRLGHVNDDGLVVVRVLSGGADLRVDESPQLLHVDGGAVGQGRLLVEPAHTDLSEPTRVELVEENAVVVLATSVTATSGVRAVLTDTAMTGRHVTTLLARLQVVGHHFLLIGRKSR